MSFRRVPKEIDPRRPPKRRGEQNDETERSSNARSYGQYVDVSPDELADLEEATDEVAREGESQADVDRDAQASREYRRGIESQEEFEEATDEVSREDSGPHR